jgi:ubiquinone/menaquinone biosynthesis C-methylase UbiE
MNGLEVASDEGFDEVEVEGNKAKILYPDQYFDAVIDLCSICMEHNFSDIFNETARLLKRGGRLFSIVPRYDCYDIFEGNDSVQFFTLEHLRKCLNGKFHSSIKLIEQELEPTKVLRFWLVDALRMT